MNISEVKKALPVLMRNKVVAFLWGAQGIGKTQVVKQVAKDLEVGFIHLHLATQEVGDLVGLLIHGENGTVKHARPEWFPTEGKGVLFLDELNRAHPDVLQAMFSLITGGTIHTHVLPEGWSIVAAGNYQTNMFNVTDTSDAAWMSRFCHIDFMPTKEEFIVYAEDKDAFGVASFIRNHPELLEVTHKERLDLHRVTPDRRSWLDMIAPLEKEDELEDMRFEVYSGIVGTTAAASFITHKKTKEQRLSGKQIIKQYDTVRKRVQNICSATVEVRLDLLNSAVDEILTFLPAKKLTDAEMNNFKNFMLDIPLEMSLKIVKTFQKMEWTQKNEIVNNKEFAEKFKNQKMKNAA